MYSQTLSPAGMCIDCLNSMKYQVLCNSYAAADSSNPRLSQVYHQMAHDYLAMSGEWYRLMSDRGWGQNLPARQEALGQTLGRLQTILGNIQNMPAQSGFQSYQQPANQPGQLQQ